MASPLITVMSNAAVKAGRVLLRDVGEVDQLQVSKKGASNFVTKTDLKVEKMLVSELKKARPEFGYLLEEGGEVKGADATHRFIIDPLDGTNNFIHAVPYFCVSIALEQTLPSGAKDLLAGVIYDPVHNELFAAEKHKGAFMNDRRIMCSPRKTLESAMLVSSNPRYSSSTAQPFAMLKAAASSEACIRHTGASALDLAYVAAGRYDACWFNSIKPWDVAAGILLVREAGGVVTHINGANADSYSETLLASGAGLHSTMVKLLAG